MFRLYANATRIRGQPAIILCHVMVVKEGYESAELLSSLLELIYIKYIYSVYQYI
jgi:hypothetical protein